MLDPIPHTVVKFPSSWHLGVWRGAYGKVRDVVLAPAIDALTYRAGYADGVVRSREIKAASRVKRAAPPAARAA